MRSYKVYFMCKKGYRVGLYLMLLCLPFSLFAVETDRIKIDFKDQNIIDYVNTIEQLNKVLAKNKLKNVVVSFKEGDYAVNEGIKLNNLMNITFLGNGARLHFPQQAVSSVYLTKALNPGEKSFKSNDNDFFKKGKRYQIYNPNKKGDRLLEFRVLDSNASFVTMTHPVKLMSHVKDNIPEKSRIYSEYNFFKIRGSSDISISGFNLNGHGFGEVRGHMIYSGILILNNFHEARKLGAPKFSGIDIYDMHFNGLKGRAVAAYATADVSISNCSALNIQAEAFEIDHFSSGTINNNLISNAHIAIQLNDAFNSTVSENTLINVNHGINFKGHFSDRSVNIDTLVVNNKIDFNRVGINLDRWTRGAIVKNNQFSYKKNAIRIFGEENHGGNTILKNTFKWNINR